MLNRKYQGHSALCIACLLVVSALIACKSSGARAQAINSSPTQISANTSTPASSTQQPSKQWQPWYEDFNALTAIASVGALVISIFALLLSHRSSTEQSRREKREELRSIIEKIISFREDFETRIVKVADNNERISLDRSSNTKRKIYLQAAEKIALELSTEVSSIEYRVLARENSFDSDFSQMRFFNKKAVEIALNVEGDHLNKAEAFRALAWGYYLEEPYRDIAEGRRCYQSAVDATKDEKDPYTIYTTIFTYREWASREVWAKEREYAVSRLNKASDLLNQLPDWINTKQDELRGVAGVWTELGTSYFQDEQLEQVSRLAKAREAIQNGLSLLRAFNDDNTKDWRGRIYQEWAKNEFMFGSREVGDKVLEMAKQCYMSLPEAHPIRLIRLNGIDALLYHINSRITVDSSSDQIFTQEAIANYDIKAATATPILPDEATGAPDIQS